MSKYHKIQTVFKRDPETQHRTLLEGDWSLPEFGYLAMNRWVFTEKVDGMNIRIRFSEGDLSFAGRTDRAQIPPPLLTRLEERFGSLLPQFREVFGDGKVVLYGEGYGKGIQKGGQYREDQDFVLFDVKIGDMWLRRDDVEDIACKFGLDEVPVVGEGTLFEMVERARDGIQSTWGDFQAEGLVARPAVELRTRNGDRVITKVKCRDFRR